MSGSDHAQHDADVDTSALAAQVRFSTLRLARRLRQLDSGAGLSATQAAALATISREGPLTLGELATREHLTPPSITNVVGKLEALGFVKRCPDATDRRVVRVEISAKGRKQLDSQRSARTAWLVSRLEMLSPADRHRLADAAAVIERLAEGP